MKDYIKDKLNDASNFNQVKAIVDDYMDYYNQDRYQWHLAKLSPNEHYQFCITGEYPLKIANLPKPPVVEKKPEELGRNINQSKPVTGAGTESRDSMPGAQRLGRAQK